MRKSEPVTNHDGEALVEDARALIAATANLAGEQTGKVRKRLHDLLEQGGHVIDSIETQAVKSAKITDKALHDHPYKVIGISLAVGALIACFVVNRVSSCRNK